MPDLSDAAERRLCGYAAARTESLRQISFCLRLRLLHGGIAPKYSNPNVGGFLHGCGKAANRAGSRWALRLISLKPTEWIPKI